MLSSNVVSTLFCIYPLYIFQAILRWSNPRKHIDNRHTLWANIKFIGTSFRNSKKSDALVNFSEREQINLIYTDNVHILCLSCNVRESPKTTT